MRNYAEFPDQEIVWTPDGNDSIINWFRTVDLGFIDYIETEKEGRTVEAGIFMIVEGRSTTEEGP